MNMKKGFTLVEIMIVVAIIAILAAVAIPNFIGYRKSAQRASCIANLKQLDSATEAWRVNTNQPNGTPAITDLFKADGTGLIRGTTKPTCPATGSDYTAPTSNTDKWKCSMSSDSDYKHAY